MKKLESLNNDLFKGFESYELSDPTKVFGGSANCTSGESTYDGDHCGEGSQSSLTCSDGAKDDLGGNVDCTTAMLSF